jgi:type II restriction enzyme
MPPGTFSFHLNVPVKLEDGSKQINIAVDAVIMPISAISGDLPLLVEAKSAGDFANVNKRRKEEATKMYQLRSTYGPQIRFNLFLCGYFDTGYLGYEAAEGIDWVWEHRIDDLALFGL